MKIYIGRGSIGVFDDASSILYGGICFYSSSTTMNSVKMESEMKMPFSVRWHFSPIISTLPSFCCFAATSLARSENLVSNLLLMY